MREINQSIEKNIRFMDEELGVGKNYDILKREMKIAGKTVCLYYVDGLITAGLMQKLMVYLTGVTDFGKNRRGDLEKFAEKSFPTVEVTPTHDFDFVLKMVLSGCSVLFADGFGNGAIVFDLREYPAREATEPENDKVMRGARDGFVETMIFNTAMIRRRIRDTHLTVRYECVGERSQTDICLVYLDDKASPDYVKYLTEKIRKIRTDALPLGHQSLMECLIKKRWYNPFPKVRTTERPDSVCASILEGSVAVVVDNSPEVMILPTCIFDFLQEADDFYFPPSTGTYLRIVRCLVFWSAILLTPLWYLCVCHPQIVPENLLFIVPSGEQAGKIPIIVQLFIVEFLMDGLKLASLNTPSVMSNSFSVVGGLLLGDFAVQIGWLSPAVILYSAVIAIASFTQSSYELGYAFKFMRLITLILIYFFDVWGFLGGALLTVLLITTNPTLNGTRSYWFPLIPFYKKELSGLFFRKKKK